MSKTKPKGIQTDTINRYSPFNQLSLDLKRQDVLATSYGPIFAHYKAVPSPIGQKDRGSYRRSDGVDTITSNGFIYKCAGKFSATMTDNSRGAKRSDGGILDSSQSRLVLPRFYNKNDIADGDRIYLAPGDRVYIADPNADVKVSNYHKMDYEQDIDNVPMFPIVTLENLIDSQNIEYAEGKDFSITKDGNIRWLAGGKNPGIDPDTGKGRIYSIRYLYNAFWYITDLPKEVRVTNVTTGGERNTERMPYHAVIVREFLYHNQNNGSKTNQLVSKDPKREVKEPSESIKPDKFAISVDMSAIDDSEDQS